MKYSLRHIIGTLVAILIVSAITQGIDYHQSLPTLFLASTILAILNSLLKPLIKILTLPINVITLGLFGWFINVFILYLVTILVPSFDIVPFSVTFGSVTLNFSGLTAYLMIALIINLVSRLVSWILDQ